MEGETDQDDAFELVRKDETVLIGIKEFKGLAKALALQALH